MSLITVKDLSVGYDRVAVETNIDFRVDEGDYLCIVGENGSGKSTLMKTILNLQPPIRGEIIYGDGLQANEIGYLPQQTFVQKDFPASVTEIVLSGCQSRSSFRPFYSRADKEKAAVNMERMRISDLGRRCYRELSGGQQQRVLLARALCATEKLLLLDEPVAGLDPKVTLEMYELISQLNGDGVTIIMISHDIQAAVKYASHILHIGDVFFFGTRDEYIGSGIGSAFIGRPAHKGCEDAGTDCSVARESAGTDIEEGKKDE
ncbi:MAG: metal ABC transporter ATP-binding protein [Lachnospiraceae bacterium]|nr:metal ABC transporter ATP-binding protein [Lachnospiraceae bacterium]